MVNIPINLTVYKRDAPDLTLVDLPGMYIKFVLLLITCLKGITRVAVADQPLNIYEIISGLIDSYIASPETVILNVIPATVDFATCESLTMSRKHDPDGNRTIGVVTKIDRYAFNLDYLRSICLDGFLLNLYCKM